MCIIFVHHMMSVQYTQKLQQRQAKPKFNNNAEIEVEVLSRQNNSGVDKTVVDKLGQMPQVGP